MGSLESSDVEESSKSVLAEPVFRQVAGALESMSSRATNQIQTLTAAINTEEDPESGRGAGSMVIHFG